MQKFRAFLQVLFLVILDLAAYFISLFFAVLTRISIGTIFKDAPPFFFTYSYFASIWWVPLVIIVVYAFERLYRVRNPFWEESKTILKSVTIAIMGVFLTVAVRNMYGDISRVVFFSLGFYMIFISPLLRYFGKMFLFHMGIWKENVLIMGADERGIATLKGVINEEHLGYHVVGFLDDDPKKTDTVITYKGKDYKIYGSRKSYDKYLKTLKIETVFISNNYKDPQELIDLINRVYQLVKRVIIIPDIKGVSIYNSNLHYLFMEKLFMIKVKNNLNSAINIFIKRAFDLFVSITGLLITFPVYLVIGLLVGLTSRGPIIFGHKRIGKGGKVFKAYKFRTMYKDAEERLHHILDSDPEAKKEWEQSYKLKKDPRVTPLGRFLRKTSLDELPQIFNIIKGDMSLVGPRPVIQDEIDKYFGSFVNQYYSVKPGLTGLWQVSGRSNTDYAFRIETDAWYVQNWSIWLDVIILFKTVPAVLKKEGAY